MISRLSRTMILLAAITLVALSGLVLPAAAETKKTDDGAEATGPAEVVVGQAITISGTDWKAPSEVGSVIAIKLDLGAVTTTRTLVNPGDNSEITNNTVYGVTRADSAGTFSVTVPFPTTPTESTTWRAGEKHSVQLLTGSLLPGDVRRSMELSFDVVAVASSPSPTPTSASPSPSASSRWRAIARAPTTSTGN